MLKTLTVVVCAAIIGASCIKNDSKTTCPYTPSTVTVPAGEQTRLAAYIDSNHIDAVKDPRGFYYKIVTPGTSTDSVKLCSQVQVSYTGQLTNDTIFDKNTNVVYVLGALIEGWKMSIPMLKRGGEMKLYLPPSLGYGSQDQVNQSTGKVVIPANSIIKFDIKLTDYTAGN